jgi:hypothetical protein
VNFWKALALVAGLVVIVWYVKVLYAVMMG